MESLPTDHPRCVRKAKIEDAPMIQQFNWSMAKVLHHWHLVRAIRLHLQPLVSGMQHMRQLDDTLISVSAFCVDSLTPDV